jgi:hypothetical protein
MECGKGMGINNLYHFTKEDAYKYWDLYSSKRPDSLIKERSAVGTVLKELNEAHAVLRSLACSLGAGGYNASVVNAKTYEEKIRWGIDALTRPLLEKIDTLEDRISEEKTKPDVDKVIAVVRHQRYSYELRKNGKVLILDHQTDSSRTVGIQNVSLTVQNDFEDLLAWGENNE